MSRQHTEERTGRAIEANEKQPLRSTQSRQPRRAYSELTSPSLEVNEANETAGNETANETGCNAKRRNNTGLHTAYPPMAHYITQPLDSSDEEYYALDSGASRLPRQEANRKEYDTGQTNEFSRSRSDQMSPPQKEERSIYRKRAPGEYKSTQGYSPVNQVQTKDENCNRSTSNHGRVEVYEARKEHERREIGVWQETDGIEGQAKTFVQEGTQERRNTQGYLPQTRFEKLPPIHHSPGIRDTAEHRQVITIDEDCEGRVFEAVGARRFGRQEVREEENQRRRRIGVCQESDVTREHRTFLRVLNKRF